jgi:TRAP-type mannitol/chloroaromatic compound transport system permease small subunit
MIKRILRAIDALNERAASISSWLVAVLIVVILYEVVSRYVFNAPTQWGFGSLRMVGSAIVVLGWAYAQLLDSHIRVDFIYIRLSERTKAVVNIIGTGLFFFPLFGALTAQAASSMWGTLLAGKFVNIYYSGAPPLPFLHKALIFLGLGLFFIQFGARFARDVYFLVRGKAL